MGKLAWLMALAAVAGGVSVRAADVKRIAVIPKGTTHSFWKSVEAGAKKAGAELGVEIIWKGPLKEDDRAQQISVVQQFVADRVDAIVLAPLDKTALRGPVKAAMVKNIPVVIFDSALDGKAGEDFVSFVATDSHAGGMLGGARLAELLGGKGKVVLLRYIEGSASTMAREQGFLDEIRKHPGIVVTADNRYAGPTSSSAKETAMNMIDVIKEADGIFCPNESSTFGMLLALRANGLAGRKKFVGFDTSEPLLKGLEAGDLQGLIAQNPGKMGYLAVKAVVAHLNGAKVEPGVDTGCALVTSENLTTPAIRELLGK